MRNSMLLAATLALPLAATLGAQQAEARLRCSGPYQLNAGGSVITPYCEDQYLAMVANAHGMAISPEALRASFGVRRSVCQVVQHDNRVSELCNRVLPDHGDHPRFHIGN